MKGDSYKAQVAALPVKGHPGSYSGLLVTSRDTGRWIIPTGWPMKGLNDCDAAAQEAFEEAGVKGRIHKHPMGAYRYDKRGSEGGQPIRVMVYLLEVYSEGAEWPEKGQRQRQWLSTRTAASRVDEPSLAEIISAWKSQRWTQQPSKFSVGEFASECRRSAVRAVAVRTGLVMRRPWLIRPPPSGLPRRFDLRT